MTTRVIRWPDSARWEMDVQLSGRVYTLRGRWNTRSRTWVIDLDSGDGVRLLSGFRAVINFPLLPRWRTEQMPPGELFILDPNDRLNRDPGRNDIGADDEPMRFVYVEPDQ